MGKLSKKLTVYLDQNFISEMAKADIKESVNPQFKNVYELLHRGFLDEKIVVPHSFFHDIETSLIPRLKERITEYCGYLGQIDLNPREHIEIFQIVRAAKGFLGEEIEPIDHSFAFDENPDQRTRMLGIKIDMRLERFNYKSERVIKAQQLDALRKNIVSSNVNYSRQLERELEAQSKFFLDIKKYKISWVFKKDNQKIEEFIKSEHFKCLPIVEIYSQMWTKILTDRNRSVKGSDATDVEIISAYLPYVDIMATDSFMANIIRNLGLDKKYKTMIFSSKNNELKTFEDYLINYLKENEPVNLPLASVFVLADNDIKNHSFDLFHDLGMMSGNIGHNKEWVDIYGFDDGNMPQYQLKKGTKLPLPFYGLQDVRSIKIDPNISISDVLEICGKRCRSEKFVLIDSYKKLPDNFIETLIEHCRSDRNRILNYRIYKKDDYLKRDTRK